MLDSMRALSKSFVSKMLMGLLVLSFALWGVGDILQNSGKPTYAAKVGGETITLNEFQRAYTMLSNQLREVGMQGVDPQKLQVGAIRQLVQDRLSQLAMHDLGLYASDTLVSRSIAQMPYFQKDGKFDADLFSKRLKDQQLTEVAFVGQVKHEALGRFLSDSVSLQDASVPESVMKLAAISEGETRDAVLFTIPARDALDEANNTALKEYYESNKETLYMNGEERTIQYVVLSPKDVNGAADAQMTKDQVLQNVRNTVEDEMAAGKNFAQALTSVKLSATPRKITVREDAAKTADATTKLAITQGFTLAQGEVSNFISVTDDHLLLVSVDAITPASAKPYDEVKADVRKRLGDKLARDAARAKAISVKKALAEKPNWQSVAQDFNLNSRPVSRLPRPVEGKNTATNGVPAALQQAIFERNVGEVAGPLALENGDIVVALITKSNIPANVEGAVVNKNSTAARDKMAQDVENRAYLSFTQKHKVIINPGIVQSPTAEE